MEKLGNEYGSQPSFGLLIKETIGNPDSTQEKKDDTLLVLSRSTSIFSEKFAACDGIQDPEKQLQAYNECLQYYETYSDLKRRQIKTGNPIKDEEMSQIARTIPLCSKKRLDRVLKALPNEALKGRLKKIAEGRLDD